MTIYSVLMLALCAALGGCDFSDNTPRCAPDASRACFCNTGAPGLETCNPEASGFDTCVCTSTDAGLADAGVDAIDASTLATDAALDTSIDASP